MLYSDKVNVHGLKYVYSTWEAEFERVCVENTKVKVTPYL